MTTRHEKDDGMARDGEVLHGGARRLRLDPKGSDLPEGQRISWYEVAPGDRCTRHVHTGKTESWLIIAGEGEAVAGERTVAVSPGALLVTEPGVPHGLVNTGSAPLRFVNVATRTGNDPVTTREVPET